MRAMSGLCLFLAVALAGCSFPRETKMEPINPAAKDASPVPTTNKADAKKPGQST